MLRPFINFLRMRVVAEDHIDQYFEMYLLVEGIVTAVAITGCELDIIYGLAEVHNI